MKYPVFEILFFHNIISKKILFTKSSVDPRNKIQK